MEQEYIDLLGRLMACAPVSEDIAAVNRASAVMEEFLASRGIHVTRECIGGRNALFASTQPGKSAQVILNAHMDVVPPSEPGQHVLRQEGHILYGRGTDDCLGNAVCIAKLLLENRDKSVAAIFTLDEEIGGLTTRGMLDRGYRPTRGVIILDCLNLTYAEKGMLNVRLTARRAATHAAHPWETENALELLMERYTLLRQQWQNPTAEDDWRDSMAATCIEASSSTHNVIPESASLNLNIRYIMGHTQEEILERIRAITGLEATAGGDCCPPVECDPQCDFFQKMYDAAQREFRQPVAKVRVCGATDARHFAQVYPEIPIVLGGVTGGNCHGKGEWLDADDFDPMARTCAAVL